MLLVNLYGGIVSDNLVGSSTDIGIRNISGQQLNFHDNIVRANANYAIKSDNAGGTSPTNNSYFHNDIYADGTSQVTYSLAETSFNQIDTASGFAFQVKATTTIISSATTLPNGHRTVKFLRPSLTRMSTRASISVIIRTRAPLNTISWSIPARTPMPSP